MFVGDWAISEEYPSSNQSGLKVINIPKIIHCVYFPQFMMDLFFNEEMDKEEILQICPYLS